jgi:Tetratricopeptide repeat
LRACVAALSGNNLRIDSGSKTAPEYLMAMREPRRGTPWRRVSWWVLFAATTIVLGSMLSVRAYRSWRVEWEVRAAKAYLEQRDNRNALLSLKAALLLRPNHLEARRALVSLLEESASAEALIHRRKLIDLQPNLLEPKLALVRTALRIGDVQEASRALRLIKGTGRKTSEVMELQAEVHLVRGRPDMALEVYRELVELRPDDLGVRAKLTALELQTGPELDRATARAALESMVSDDEFGLLALRALAKDALQINDLSAALEWSKRASEMPLAELSDRMLYLQALFAAKSPSFEDWHSDLEKAALENTQFALELAKWKVDALGPQAASTWLERLPKSIRENPATCVLLAECYSTLKRWNDLESLVVAGAWRELEGMRLALLARSQAGQGNLRKAERTWQSALETAEKHPQQLASLLAMARADKRDVRQVLWMIAERDPQNISARQELYQAYWQERNADGMLRMMELVLKERPNDRAAKYSVASLLLATGRQVERARGLAKELYDADPLNLGNAVLYSFGLHLQGNSRMAADLIGARDDLHKLGNDGAAYYSLVLSGCGRDEEARRILSMVNQETLLPELRASLDRAFGTLPKDAVTHQPD